MTDPWSVTDVPVHLAEAGEDTRSVIGDWSQGDLVEGLPTTWIAPQIDVVTGVGLEDRRQGPEGDGEVLEPVFDPDATGAWVIASQTCDIGAGSPGSHHAFVLVAPLTPAKRLPASTTGLALKGGVNYLVPVDHERQEQEAPRWFADLRMLMPVSKAVLLTRQPRSAFASEEATLKFAEHLGARFRRPALHAALSEELGRAINRHIQKRMKQSAFAHTEHVRLVVKTGSRLEPKVVSLVVVLRERLEPADQEVWRDVDAAARSVLTPHGIMLDPTLIGTAESLSAQTYRMSVPLRITSLGNVGFW